MTPPDPASAADALRQGAARGVPVEEFGPVWTSARFRLARAGWQAQGAQPFLSGDVPYAATCGGRLSEDAAEIVLAARPGARGLRILEIGAGTGVFARIFLSVLRDRAPDVHAATRYVVSDGSPSVLEAMAASGVLEGHAGVAETRVFDLAIPGDDPGGGFDAILGTYILDVMPFDLLAVRDAQVWRREVRGVLDGADAAMAPALRAALAGPDAGLVDLAWLGPRLGLQVRHVPVDRAALPRPEALPVTTWGQVLPVTHHFGALDAIDRCLGLLRPGGVMVFSDYAHATPPGGGAVPEFEGYGTSISTGLDFAALDAVLEARRDLRLWKPEDEAGALRTRVLQRGAGPDLGAVVTARHGALRVHEGETALEAAREAARAGRIERARAGYAALVAAEPWNWHLMREAAFFLLLTAGEAAAADALAVRGLALNPLDADLWRVRAEAALALGEAAAGDHARRACGLSPGVPHVHHTLARVLLRAGDHGGALAAVAAGLAADRDATLRGGLTGVQGDVLAAIDAARAEDRRRRANAFRVIDAGPF
ncbi:MAG: hypothetical protein KF887_12250 [Paracoccaceae bacterium]|nr:MAG: hypothetical protein KF887_12250 [Paracoccaceae bacterium]